MIASLSANYSLFCFTFHFSYGFWELSSDPQACVQAPLLLSYILAFLTVLLLDNISELV